MAITLGARNQGKGSYMTLYKALTSDKGELPYGRRLETSNNQYIIGTSILRELKPPIWAAKISDSQGSRRSGSGLGSSAPS